MAQVSDLGYLKFTGNNQVKQKAAASIYFSVGRGHGQFKDEGLQLFGTFGSN